MSKRILQKLFLWAVVSSLSRLAVSQKQLLPDGDPRRSSSPSVTPRKKPDDEEEEEEDDQVPGFGLPGINIPQLCSICPDPADGITNGESVIVVADQPRIRDCLSLQAHIELDGVLASDRQCQLYKLYGSYCGCPLPLDSCRLCGSNPENIVSNPTRSLPLFVDWFHGIIPDCLLMESALASTVTAGDAICPQYQLALFEYCGCGNLTNAADLAPSTPDVGIGGIFNSTERDTGSCDLCFLGGVVQDKRTKLDLGLLPFAECGWLESALDLLFDAGSSVCQAYQQFSPLCGCSVREDSCPLCGAGAYAATVQAPQDVFGISVEAPSSPLLYPTREMPFVQYSEDWNMTCEYFEALTFTTVLADSETCDTVQLLAAGYCGCPLEYPDDYCEPLCEEASDTSELPLEIYKRRFGFAPTCDHVQSFRILADDAFCDTIPFARRSCGCQTDPYELASLGAVSRRDELGLLWARRVAAIMSILASLFVCIDIFKDKEKRVTVYHQLVFGMCLFDLMTALSWVVVRTIPLDAILSGEIPIDHIDTECKIHSFFFQLGLATSVFYKAVLIVAYYLFILVSNLKENALKENRLFSHGIPLLIGLLFASSGIPFYPIVPFVCFINPFVNDPALDEVVGLFVLPLGFSLLVATLAVLMVHLLGGQSNSRKQVGRNATRDDQEESLYHQRLRRRVTLQASLYLMVPYPTIFFLLAAALAASHLNQQAYGFWVLVMLFTPLQGFGNFLVYISPRIQRWIRVAHETNHASAPRKYQEAEGPGLRAEDEDLYVDPSVAIAAQDDYVVAARQNPLPIYMDEGLGTNNSSNDAETTSQPVAPSQQAPTAPSPLGSLPTQAQDTEPATPEHHQPAEPIVIVEDHFNSEEFHPPQYQQGTVIVEEMDAPDVDHSNVVKETDGSIVAVAVPQALSTEAAATEKAATAVPTKEERKEEEECHTKIAA